MAYTNNDGLVILYAPEDSEKALGGSRSLVNGPYNKVEWLIKASELPAHTDADGQLYLTLQNVSIPAGAILRNAELFVTTGFTSGGSATLTLGLAEADGTAIDADGIDVDIALTAISAVGERVACDGALVATTGGGALAERGYLWVEVNTASFTAGEAILTVEYLLP